MASRRQIICCWWCREATHAFSRSSPGKSQPRSRWRRRLISPPSTALFHYNDYLKELQYISYFITPRYAATNRILISRFTRAVAQSQNWLNDPRNEKEAARILIRHLKIDDTLAARTYRYMLTDGKAYRGEAKVDGPGLAEMIRMLAEADVIPQKEPWQSFVLE